MTRDLPSAMAAIRAEAKTTSKPIKHIPVIEPSWPAVFRDPLWWGRQDGCYYKFREVKDGELQRAAGLMRGGMSIAKASIEIGRPVNTIASEVADCGGKEAFIAKYAGGA